MRQRTHALPESLLLWLPPFQQGLCWLSVAVLVAGVSQGGPCAPRGPHWALWGPCSLHTAGPGGQHTLAWRHRDSLGSVNGDVRFFDPRMPESVNVLQIVKGLTALDIHPQASLIAW